MPNPPIVAIGDPDTVEVFAAFGIGVIPIEDGDDVHGAVQQLVNDDEVQIVLMTEPVYLGAKDLVERLREQPTPAITLIPTVAGNQHIAAEQLRNAVRVAIGSEIV